MSVEEFTYKDRVAELVFTIDLLAASESDSSKFSSFYEGDQTTHLSVIDKDGNAVSLTYTLEYSYGARLVPDDLGFLMNNEMGDFNPVPGLTNSRGLIGTPANLIEPEKRMLSSMSPTIVTRDGKPVLVIGSPGGRTIINSVFQTVVNVLVHEMNIARAIESGKIHHQWLPDRIMFENDAISPDTKIVLESMGHQLFKIENIGSLMGIKIDQQSGIISGHADSSSPDGGAAGH